MAEEEEKPPVPRKAWAPILLIAGAALCALGVKDHLVQTEPSRPQSTFEASREELGVRKTSTTKAEIEVGLGAFLMLAGGGLFLFRPRIEDEDEAE